MKEQRGNYCISYLRCGNCGNIMPIPRRKNRLREKNHIKTMYCYHCRAVRDFLENYEGCRFEEEYGYALILENRHKVYEAAGT